jgi:hypothetical protein
MIISNKAQCRSCGEIIESMFRHDFVMCKCGKIAVDGGRAYLKRTGYPYDIIELSESKEDPPQGEVA